MGARAQRDDLAAALLQLGVRIPSPAAGQEMGALAWGRAPCALCLQRSRDALACRGALRHTEPDVEAGWAVGGRVTFARRAAVLTSTAALGAGLLPDGHEGLTDGVTVVGVITTFDWPSGVHTVRRDGHGGGLLRVRLRHVAELRYRPPEAPALPDA
jgi:hypothetical protein